MHFNRREAILALGCGGGWAIAPVAFGPARASELTAEDALEAIRRKYRLGQFRFAALPAGRNAEAFSIGLGGASAHAPVKIASLSKSITGMAVARLIQDGKLSLSAKLVEFLRDDYAAMGRTIDPSLARITIEHLLTHTAGLRTNSVSDPVNGISSESVLRQLSSGAGPLDYVVAANADKSTGLGKYVYSNISYAFLGVIIEKASGESYADYCGRRILKPLGVSSVSIDAHDTPIGPHGGWQMSLPTLLRVWVSVFGSGGYPVLSSATLRSTLLASLGSALGAKKDARYTLGAWVRKGGDGKSFRAWHNGIYNFRGRTHFYSYLEFDYPSGAWMVSTDKNLARPEQLAMHEELRTLAEKLVGGS